MGNVLFASVAYERYDSQATLPAKFGRLLDESGMKDVVSGKSVAVKMHVGRGIGYTTIPPLFVKILIDRLKAWGADPFVTDQSVEGARVRGYTEELFGCPIVDVCGILGKYYYAKEVNFNTFKHVDIAGHIYDADVMIDLSHVKGHGACGYGGACKNIAMGCVTDRTRQEIHRLEGGISWDESLCVHCDQCVANCNHNANKFNEDGKYEVFFHGCTFCGHCVKVCPTGAIAMDTDHYEDFQTGMAVATAKVLESFAPGSVFYVNFMTQMTALCDCWGFSSPSLVPDIGVAFSDDIVSVERFCLDKIDMANFNPLGAPIGYEMGETGHLFERLHHKDPFIQLRKLEEQGLGTQTYTVKEVK